MKNILYINAGAGSGKTYTLTHKLADEIAKGTIQPSEVIVATYTRAAAAEIKERARTVLLEKGMVQAAAELDSAAIGTVHAVAQKLLARYWYALDTTPNQLVITEEDKAIYRNTSLAQMMQKPEFEQQYNIITQYFNVFQPYTDSETKKPDPNFWTIHLEKLIGKISYYQVQDKEIEESIEKSKQIVDGLFNESTAYTGEEFKFFYDTILPLAKAQLEKKPSGKTWKDIVNKLKKINTLQITYKSINDLLSVYKKALKAWGIEQYTETILAWKKSRTFGALVKDYIDALFTLARIWMKDYETFKKNHGIIDYDDMEKGLLALLKNEEIRTEISKSFKLVMVDEFQDCNPIQLQIFDLFSDLVEKSVWVGDPNQAIYGFRGSDTKLINRVAQRFPTEKNKPDANGLEYDFLPDSHRSVPALVNLSNDLFKDHFELMTPLKPVREKQEELLPPLQHWHIKANNLNEMREGLAYQIIDWVEGGTAQFIPKGEKQPRALTYKDIAILVNTGKRVKDIVSCFQSAGIPVSTFEEAIYDRAEVQLVMALLNLSEGYNAHEWASVLKLGCGWSTEKILEHRIQYLQEATEDGPKWLYDEEDLQSFRTVVKNIIGKPLDQKISTLILELQLMDYVQIWGNTEIRRKNLSLLQNIASQYAERCNRLNLSSSAQDFATYVQQYEVPYELDNEAPTLKVLTYHKSKGLEWPVVILADLQVDIEKHLYDDEYLGVHEQEIPGSTADLFPRYHILVVPNAMSSVTDFKEQIDQDPRLEESRQHIHEERRRLMYVGLTRARDCAVTLTSSKDSIAAKEVKWLQTCQILNNSWNLQLSPGQLVDFWQQPLHLSLQQYIDATPMENADETAEAENEHVQPEEAPLIRLRALEPLQYNQFPKRMLNPSKLTATEATQGLAVELSKIRTQRVPVSQGVAYNRTTLGTCIHQIFAACPSVNGELTPAQIESFVKRAQRILHNYGYEKVLPNVPALCESLQDLYTYLAQTYGPATGIVHEYPFYFPQAGGQVMKGEIDLIWETKRGDVIVDFKNYQGEPDDPEGTLTQQVLLEPSGKHYVGTNYVPQLHAYQQILEKAGRNVQAALLYYDLLGWVITLK